MLVGVPACLAGAGGGGGVCNNSSTYTALQGDPLSRSQYEEMCEEMFAEADDGWDEGQLRAFYDGDSEALRRDYAKVVRGTRTSTAQPPRPPSTTIQPSAEAPPLARPASVASVPASSLAGCLWGKGWEVGSGRDRKASKQTVPFHFINQFCSV